MRNCSKCLAWRVLSDYQPYFSKKRNKEYLKRTCYICCRKKDKERYKNFSPKQKKRLRERTREYAAARRRREGIPVKNITKNGYGSGRVKNNIGKLHSLDPAPLMKEVSRLKWSNAKVALGAKSDERRVRDWIAGKEKISLDAADRLCDAIGTHLSIVYPYDETIT